MLDRLLFESTWLLAVVWAAAQFVLIAAWSWRRGRPWARIVWVGFVALPLLFVMSSLVVTARERIVATCEHLAASVEAGDLAAIEHTLADGFETEGLDREAFIERLERSLTRYHVWDVALRQFEVTFQSADVSIVKFHATSRVRSADLIHDRLASRWCLTFRHARGAWQITKIKSVPTPPLNLGGLRGWLQ